MGAPIIWNGTKAKIIAPGGLIDSSGNTIGGGTLPYTNKTANFTASAGNGYLVNTTAGALTCTLPTGAANSCIRLVDDLGTWKQNNLTIAPATGEKIQGQTTNDTLVCDVAGGWVELNYDTTNTCWNVISSGYAGSTYTGPIVTDWTAFTLVTQGFGTTANNVAWYRRVGDTIELTGRFDTGTTTASEARLSFPAGLTPSASTSGPNDTVIKGKWWRGVATATTKKTGVLFLNTTAAAGGYLLWGSDDYTGTSNPITALAGNAAVASTETQFFHVTGIQISQWQSQNNIAYQNDVEYAYNSAAFANGSDTTTFAYGKTGLAMATLTGTCTRRVRFTTPINDGDRIKLQVQGVNAGSTWLDADALGMSLIQQGSNAYGHQINGVSGSSTDVDVYFYAYAQCTGITYGAAGTNWNSGWKWRLCKSSGGQVVGFGNVVPGTSAGLVSANGLTGNVTGNAIGSGYVGEKLVAVDLVGTTSSATPDLYTNATGLSLSLTAGVWMIGYGATVQALSASGGVRMKLATAGAVSGSTAWTNTVNVTTMARAVPIVLTAADTLTLQLRGSSASCFVVCAQNQTGGLTDPDTENVLYAVRIA